jgi:hypothetical protein
VQLGLLPCWRRLDWSLASGRGIDLGGCPDLDEGLSQLVHEVDHLYVKLTPDCLIDLSLLDLLFGSQLILVDIREHLSCLGTHSLVNEWRDTVDVTLDELLHIVVN